MKSVLSLGLGLLALFGSTAARGAGPSVFSAYLDCAKSLDKFPNNSVDSLAEVGLSVSDKPTPKDCVHAVDGRKAPLWMYHITFVCTEPDGSTKAYMFVLPEDNAVVSNGVVSWPKGLHFKFGSHEWSGAKLSWNQPPGSAKSDALDRPVSSVPNPRFDIGTATSPERIAKCKKDNAGEVAALRNENANLQLKINEAYKKPKSPERDDDISRMNDRIAINNEKINELGSSAYQIDLKCAPKGDLVTEGGEVKLDMPELQQYLLPALKDGLSRRLALAKASFDKNREAWDNACYLAPSHQATYGPWKGKPCAEQLPQADRDALKADTEAVKAKKRKTILSSTNHEAIRTTGGREVEVDKAEFATRPKIGPYTDALDKCRSSFDQLKQPASGLKSADYDKYVAGIGDNIKASKDQFSSGVSDSDRAAVFSKPID